MILLLFPTLDCQQAWLQSVLKLHTVLEQKAAKADCLKQPAEIQGFRMPKNNF